MTKNELLFTDLISKKSIIVQFFYFFAIKVKNVQTISYNILASGAVPIVLVLIYVLVGALAVNIG